MVAQPVRYTCGHRGRGDVVADGGYIAIRRRMGGWALGDTTTGMFAIATTDGFRRSTRYWTPPPDDSGWMDNELDRNPFVERDRPLRPLSGITRLRAVRGRLDRSRHRVAGRHTTPVLVPHRTPRLAHAWSAQRANASALRRSERPRACPARREA